MSRLHSPSRILFPLMVMGMSLPGRAGESVVEVGTTVKDIAPLGDYRTETLGGVKFGVGVGLRTRFKLHPRHLLTARVDYDYFPEGNAEVHGYDWTMQRTIQVKELTLGLTYEWHYSDAAKGGYLLVGPVHRRWNYHQDETYIQMSPWTIPPANTSYDATPSKVGLDLGWGWQSDSGSVIEIHLITSKFGETDAPANTIQFAFTQYW